MFKLLKPDSCEECGSSAVSHRAKYFTVTVDSILKRLFHPRNFMRSFFSVVKPFEHTVTLHLFHVCLKAGIAKKQIEVDDDVQLLAQMLWREAATRGIDVWEFRLFGLPRNIFVAEFSDGKRITYEGIPAPSHGSHQVWWIDDKAVLKKEFQRLRIPVAKGATSLTRKSALKVFKELETPVIMKPHSGSGSRHTILHIEDEKEFLRAFSVVKQVSPAAVIEEELNGAVYRATVVDGKLAATLRRDPPGVVGDGRSTVNDLINEANKHPGRSGPFFSKIRINNDNALCELDWYGHKFEDILPKGKRVNFHQKVNWSVGGTTADVSDEVHPDNVVLFERVAKVLKAPIVGIDFIIEDISRSWKEQERCGVIECNSMPFFDNHHLPFEGKPRNVAGAIWDMVERYR